MKTNLRELFRVVSKKISHGEILRLSGIETTRNPSSYISQALTQNQTIPFSLADFVLDHTINADDPIERAMIALGEAGIPAEQLPSLRSIIESIPKVPSVKHLPDPEAHKVVENTKTEARVVMTPTKSLAREPEPPYGKPIGPRSSVNLRHLLKVFHRTTPDDPKSIPIPKWLNMAAGDGSDLELCEDYIYFRELPEWKGVHSAVIRGDSMLQTLEPGDVVVMKEFDGGTWQLPQIEDPDEKAPLVEFKRRTKLADNDICVLSINNEPPTLKRIVFDVSRGINWKLQIVADNPPAWRPTFQVALGDKVVFHAKIMGISDESRTQLRAKDDARAREDRLKTKKKI